MRIRLNVRLLAATLLGLALAGTGIHFLHAYQVKRNAGLLLRQADRSVEEGKLEQAATLLHWYLSYEPTDTEALAKYGLLLEKQARSPAARLQAMLVLDDALRHDPARNDVRFRLVHCLILQGKDRLPAAIKHLEALLPGWANPGEIEHMLGWCHEMRGDYPRAVEWFSKSVAKAPSRLASYALRAEVLQTQLDQSEEATEVMDQMVAANAHWHQAYLERARYRQKLGQIKEADQDIARALELAPDDLGVLLAAAESAQAARQFDKSRQILERGLSRHPKEAVLHKALAGLEFRAGNRKEAIACLQRGIRKVAESNELRVLLADHFIDQQQLTEAKQILAELQKEDVPSALPDYLRARLLMVDKKWGQAANLLERCRGELAPAAEWNAAVNFSLGTCYGRLGDVDHQLAAYERALGRDPSWTAARMGLGTALLSAGRVDEALLQFRAVEPGPAAPPELWPMLARSLLMRNLRMPAGQRDWDAVDKAIRKIDHLQKTSVDVPLLQADMLLAQGKLDEAGALLAKASDQQPDEPALWCARAELAARQGRWNDADGVLKQGEKRLGDRLDFRLARIRMWTQRGGPEARQALADLGRNAAALSADDKVLLDRALADVWARLGDAEASRALWQGLAKQLPHDLQCRFALFELALKKNRLDEARDLRKEIQELDGPGGSLSLYGKAALIAAQSGKGDEGTLAQAKQILAGLARKQDGWARVPLLEARIAELERNPNRAMERYLRAFELGERQARLAHRLASLLFSRRQYREADQVVRRLEEDAPLDKDLAILGAEIALAQHDARRALQLAKQAVTPEARDYRELQWLARILDAAGEPARAEAAWRRAATLAPHNPDCWLALIHHLARTGQASAADAAFEQMRGKLPADRRDLALARALEVLGRLEPAESLFEKCVAARPADFIALENIAEFYLRQDRPEKAEAYLRRLLDPVVATPGDHAVWVRRHLAVLLAARDTSKDRQLALDLLEENRKLLGDNASDQRARALVLAGAKEQRRQAVQAFERTLAGQPLALAEQYWLVQLYELAGEYDKARDWILGLLAAEADHPRYLARYIRILIHQGQATEAQRILNRFERLEPNSRRIRELKDAVAKALLGMVS